MKTVPYNKHYAWTFFFYSWENKRSLHVKLEMFAKSFNAYRRNRNKEKREGKKKKRKGLEWIRLKELRTFMSVESFLKSSKSHSKLDVSKVNSENPKK